jgi:hypothetical protein
VPTTRTQRCEGNLKLVKICRWRPSKTYRVHHRKAYHGVPSTSSKSPSRGWWLAFVWSSEQVSAFSTGAASTPLSLPAQQRPAISVLPALRIGCRTIKPSPRVRLESNSVSLLCVVIAEPSYYIPLVCVFLLANTSLSMSFHISLRLLRMRKYAICDS